MTALATRQVEKPWGRESLPPPFVAPAGERIGEIWFEPPPELPSLLVKYIFTSEKLSVQVHPDDDQARAMGHGANGKEECWLVIDAEPRATLGIGFREPIDAEAMRAAALDGSIEELLVWHPVRAGDFFYIPANTVHAIGAGVSLIEVQQNADITFRLYDYGRPRELHLDEAIAVASGAPHEGIRAAYDRPLLVIPRKGTVSIGGETLAPGSCGYAATISVVGSVSLGAHVTGTVRLLVEPVETSA